MSVAKYHICRQKKIQRKNILYYRYLKLYLNFIQNHNIYSVKSLAKSASVVLPLGMKRSG